MPYELAGLSGHDKVVFGRYGIAGTPNTCNMWSSNVMLKHSTADAAESRLDI